MPSALGEPTKRDRLIWRGMGVVLPVRTNVAIGRVRVQDALGVTRPASGSA